MKLFKKAKKGFTLVELVVVIAVIAILAAVSVGAYFGVTESAKNSQAQQEGKAVHTNILLVANDPANECGATFSSEGLKCVLTEASDTDNTKLNTLEEAVEFAASIKYTFSEADLTSSHDFKTNGSYVKFTKTGDYYTSFTYYVDADHSATFDIVTGAQA